DRTPERELVPLCLDQGVGIIPYYPLAGGILTGKYTDASAPPQGSRVEKDPNFARFFSEERLALGREVSRLAAELGCTPSALSIAWLMQRPAVTSVIVGATSVQQLKENASSVSLELSTQILQELDRISEGTR